MTLEQLNVMSSAYSDFDGGNYDDEVIDLIDYTKELQAKLEKAVELPCKVGDAVYQIVDNEIVAQL